MDSPMPRASTSPTCGALRRLAHHCLHAPFAINHLEGLSPPAMSSSNARRAVALAAAALLGAGGGCGGDDESEPVTAPEPSAQAPANGIDGDAGDETRDAPSLDVVEERYEAEGYVVQEIPLDTVVFLDPKPQRGLEAGEDSPVGVEVYEFADNADARKAADGEDLGEIDLITQVRGSLLFMRYDSGSGQAADELERFVAVALGEEP
ncbi:MAG: hypothetical protein M3370_13415 [Actinomycetota bacterium]|nr:hypothetical protein [Actinomycetota bacterium]